MKKEKTNMKNKNEGNPSGGIGFFGALQVALIVMKLCDVIHWSWWLVFVPVYISIGIAFVIFVLALLIAGSDK